MVITVRKRSYGKVMFSQACVIFILSTGGRGWQGACVQRDMCGWRHGETYVAGGMHEKCKRAVRIILKCFLVKYQ